MYRLLWYMNALAIDYLGVDAALLPPFGRNAELETPDCVPQSFAGTFFRQAYSLLLNPRLFAR